MKDKILFVTKGGDQCEEGFSYVLELAKTLNAGIEVLIMSPARLATKFEDVMAAAAFAEAGDLKTMREIMEEKHGTCREKLEARIRELSPEAEGTAVNFLCHTGDGDIATAIKSLLKDKPYVDMVLLSPSLSENRNSLHVRKLLKNISKPVVHISKYATAEI